jgi:hypothetical protein
MTQTLVGVNNFGSGVVVPTGSDDHHALSAFIVSFVQRLINNDVYLKARLDTAAQLGSANNFTQPNTFTSITASGPVQGGSFWTAGGAQIGTNIGIGGNATVGGTLHAHGTIDSDGDVHADGNLTGTHLIVTGNIVGGGAITSPTGNLGVNKFQIIGGAANFTGSDFKISSGTLSIDSTVKIVYTGNASQRVRTVGIPLCSGKVVQGSPTMPTLGQYWQGGSGANSIIFPLRLTNACTLVNVGAYFLTPNPGSPSVVSIKMTAIDWGQPSLVAADYANASQLGTANATQYSTTLAYRMYCVAGSHVVNNSFETFWVEVFLGTTTGNRLYGLDYTYIDAEISTY